MRYHDNSYFTTRVAGAALVVLLLVNLACNTGKSRNGNFKAIKLITSYPLVLPDNGKLIIIEDTIPVYYYRDFVLYSLPYTKTEEKNGTLLKMEKKYNHFVFKINTRFGLWFDSVSSEQGMVLPVDSVLFNRGYATNFNIRADSLSQTIIENGFILEKYIPRRLYGEDYYDSAYYYFSNDFNKINYSFSKKMDSVRAERLFKVRLIYNEKFYKSFNLTAPKREFVFKLEYNNNFNFDEIIQLFRKFQSNAQILP